MNNKRRYYKKVEIEETIHKELANLCYNEEISMKLLASELLEYMIVEQKEETKRIAKQIKMRKV